MSGVDEASFTGTEVAAAARSEGVVGVADDAGTVDLNPYTNGSGQNIVLSENSELQNLGIQDRPIV